jgi:hypothetical protein
MQVTKNEKIVQVSKEETFDITGLTKAQAIALLALVANSNGDFLYDLYKNLDEQLGMRNSIDLKVPLRHYNGDKFTANFCAVAKVINKLAQE